ncbi:MAG: insulinase family protein [Deltaproteobacteria bacterium]|nr:insulinase family protein [Deltaproteobacteria bacterium]
MSRIALLLALLAPAAALAGPPAIAQKTLPNGLTVLVAEDHSMPLVTVEIAFKNGSMTEPPELSGLSHLYEHMFFKANAALPDQESWLARARALGLSWNGTTNTERVNYFFTTTTGHFKDAMVFMRDAIVSPLFDAKEFERERVVVTGEIDRNESNPFYFFNHAVQQRMFWKYPTRKDPLGSRESVLTATVEKMRTIQKRYYVPNNGALVITGDVSADAVFAMAGELYAGWARGEDPFVKFPLVKHPPLPYTSVVLVEQPVQAPAVSLNWHGPSVVPQELESTYAADLISFVMAEPSSKWQRDLVDSGACAGAAPPNWFTQQNVGPINVTLQAAPEKLDGCIQAALAELPKLKDPAYLTDAELANAAFHAEVDQTLQRERSSALSGNLTFWWTVSSLDYYLGYVDALKKTSRAQIAHYVDTYILGKPMVLGALVSPEMVKEKHLDLAHFEALVGGKPWVAPEPKEGEAAAKPAAAAAGKAAKKDAKAPVKAGPGAKKKEVSK